MKPMKPVKPNKWPRQQWRQTKKKKKNDAFFVCPDAAITEYKKNHSYDIRDGRFVSANQNIKEYRPEEEKKKKHKALALSD